MQKRWVISDTHFDHKNILNFERPDGSKVRPGFEDVHDMNNQMVERWNSVVKPNDMVYHLGDFTINRSVERLETLVNRLNGTKILIRGNHDHFKTETLVKFFKDVYSVYDIYINDYRVIFSHYPLHESSIWADNMFNVHGHIHEKNLENKKYINVSVEQINYTPFSFDELYEKIKEIDKNKNV
ncbi:MAG: metallophosphoesterase family protein [bacterium]